MELKLDGTLSRRVGEMGSNRTFMELKFNNNQSRKELNSVLIVPLWN